MMKTPILSTLLAFMMLTAVYAEEGPPPDKKEQKSLDLMFGIFPNSKFGVNTYALLNYYYAGNYSSGIQWYNRKYNTLDENREELEETTESYDRMDLDIDIMRFKRRDSGGAVRFSPALSFVFYREVSIYQFTSSWYNGTVKELYFERFRHFSNAYMPVIKADLELRTSEKTSIEIGAKVIPISYDNNRFGEYSVTTDPDPAAQRDAYWESNLNVKFWSYGGGISLTLMLRDLSIGSITLTGNVMVKRGESENIDRWWDTASQETISENYTSDEERLTIGVDLYYQMDFLKMSGAVPLLKFGWQYQSVTIDGEEDDYLSNNTFDFGIAFKF